jgi:YD repeat-containing protein
VVVGGDEGGADGTEPADIVTSTQTTFDGDGNAIFVASTSNGTGSVASRPDYVANYYDSANRLVETADLGSGLYSGTPGGPPPTQSQVAGITGALVSTDSYDSGGFLQLSTDPRGVMTKYINDSLGRPTTTIAGYTDGNPTATSNQTTVDTYDGPNHVLTSTVTDVTAGSGGAGTITQRTTYNYSTSGGSIAGDDDVLSITYPDHSSENFSYDALGDVTSEIGRDSSHHNYVYDAEGRKLPDTAIPGPGVDNTITQLSYQYNTLGNIIAADSSGPSGLVNEVTESYNGFGQLVSDAQSHSGPVVTGSTPTVTYGYSTAAGGSVLVSMTYPDSQVLNYTYGDGVDDEIGRIDAGRP